MGTGRGEGAGNEPEEGWGGGSAARASKDGAGAAGRRGRRQAARRRNGSTRPSAQHGSERAQASGMTEGNPHLVSPRSRGLRGGVKGGGEKK